MAASHVMHVLLAAIALIVLVGSLALLLLFAFMCMARRQLIHDINGNVGLACLANHNGSQDGVAVGLDTIRALLDKTEPVRVKLARVVLPICRFIENATGIPIDTSLDYGVFVNAAPEPLRKCLTNLFLNGAEAARRVDADGTVRVVLDASHLEITNPAHPRDRSNLQRAIGATSKDGDNHGVGRSSAALACESLGWRLSYQIDGDRVLTRLEWPELA